MLFVNRSSMVVRTSAARYQERSYMLARIDQPVFAPCTTPDLSPNETMVQIGIFAHRKWTPRGVESLFQLLVGKHNCIYTCRDRCLALYARSWSIISPRVAVEARSMLSFFWIFSRCCRIWITAIASVLILSYSSGARTNTYEHQRSRAS